MRRKQASICGFEAAGSNDLFTIGCDLLTIDRRGWTADTRSNPALDPDTAERGHSDSFEQSDGISNGGDCRRRDRATRSYKRKLKRDTRNMICGAHGDRCTRVALG